MMHTPQPPIRPVIQSDTGQCVVEGFPLRYRAPVSKAHTEKNRSFCSTFPCSCPCPCPRDRDRDRDQNSDSSWKNMPKLMMVP